MKTDEFKVIATMMLIAATVIATMTLAGAVLHQRISEEDKIEESSKLFEHEGKTIRRISGSEKPVTIHFTDGSYITFDCYKYSLEIRTN